MIHIIEDTMPHVHIFSHWANREEERLNINKISIAYDVFAASYKGVLDYMMILDGICEGSYSAEEVIAAGSILLYALDGNFIRNNIVEKAKYIRINGGDIILLMEDNEILAGKCIDGGEFYGDNGKRYSFKFTVAKKRIDRANGQPSKDE